MALGVEYELILVVEDVIRPATLLWLAIGIKDITEIETDEDKMSEDIEDECNKIILELSEYYDELKKEESQMMEYDEMVYYNMGSQGCIDDCIKILKRLCPISVQDNIKILERRCR